MKNLFAALLTLISSAGFTQELNTFSNGDVADANLINDNFMTIDQRLKSIEQSSVTSASGSNSLEDWGAVGFDTVVIDCDVDSAELEKKWSEIGKKKGRVVVDIMGTCVLSQDLTNLFIFSQSLVDMDSSHSKSM